MTNLPTFYPVKSLSYVADLLFQSSQSADVSSEKVFGSNPPQFSIAKVLSYTVCDMYIE